MPATSYIGEMPEDFGDELLEEFVQLNTEKRELEARLEIVKEKTATIEAFLLDDWANRSIQSVKIKGRIVYVRRGFYCWKRGDVETQKVCDALKHMGHASMVSPGYSGASLKALVREIIDNGEPVPPELDALLKYDIIPQLRTRAS